MMVVWNNYDAWEIKFDEKLNDLSDKTNNEKENILIFFKIKKN